MKNNGSISLLNILTLGILQSAPNDPKPNSKNQTRNSTLINMHYNMHFLGLRVQIFIRLAPRSVVCKMLQHFRISPLTRSHVKISKCHNIFPIVKKSDSLHIYSSMVANVLTEFGSFQMKTVGELAF